MSILETALALVTGVRRVNYGHPLDNHERIARLATARFWDKLRDPVNDPLTAEDCTSFARMMKEARLIETPGHEDSLVDIAGYADVEHQIHEERGRRASL